MISQRDINAFFTVLDVLANPEKAKSELKVLLDMRASVDADLQRVGEQSQRAQSMMTEAREKELLAEEDMKRATQIMATNEVIRAKLNEEADKAFKDAKNNQEINRLLNLREEEITKREQEVIQKISRYETSLADYNVRNEALRKNEADYRERMSKLRSISN